MGPQAFGFTNMYGDDDDDTTAVAVIEDVEGSESIPSPELPTLRVLAVGSKDATVNMIEDVEVDNSGPSIVADGVQSTPSFDPANPNSLRQQPHVALKRKRVSRPQDKLSIWATSKTKSVEDERKLRKEQHEMMKQEHLKRMTLLTMKIQHAEEEHKWLREEYEYKKSCRETTSIPPPC